MFTIIYSYYDKNFYEKNKKIEAKTLKGIKSKLKKAYHENDFKDIERVSFNLKNENFKEELK